MVLKECKENSKKKTYERHQELIEYEKNWRAYAKTTINPSKKREKIIGELDQIVKLEFGLRTRHSTKVKVSLIDKQSIVLINHKNQNEIKGYENMGANGKSIRCWLYFRQNKFWMIKTDRVSF